MLTPAELAATLKVSERTVARMVGDGCPSMLARGRRRFELDAVKQWMEERAQCQSARTTKADGTSKSVSNVADFIAAARKVQVRAMPRGSKPS